MGIFRKKIDYREFIAATEELKAENARHSGNFGMWRLMEDWGNAHLSSVSNDALHRITVGPWPDVFKGQVAAEIARRERRLNRTVLVVGVLTLIAAIAVPLVAR